MDLKSIRKGLGRLLAWFGLGLCSFIVRFIPARFLYGFASWMGSLGYFIAAKHRRIALESLETALGSELKSGERKRLAKECFVLMAKGAIELMFLMDRPALLKERVTFSGRDNLDKALLRGNGVILVSAHFGNFPLLMAKLSLEGYKVSGIMRQMRDERVERIFDDKRSKLGIKTIYSQPRDTCVSSTIQALRNNEIVFIPIDQNFGTAGVFVDFFGRKAATATGPVVLAQRTKASLMPCFIVRQADNTNKIIFEPPIELKDANDAKEAVQVNIQRLTSIIESYIRKYPAEWGWVHRRWKSRPGEKSGS